MKDATATSLYGARGANGVILVTTKEGKKVKPEFHFDMKILAPSQTNEFVEAVEYMELYNKAQRSRDQSAILLYSKDKLKVPELVLTIIFFQMWIGLINYLNPTL